MASLAAGLIGKSLLITVPATSRAKLHPIVVSNTLAKLVAETLDDTPHQDDCQLTSNIGIVRRLNHYSSSSDKLAEEVCVKPVGH
jgi:hypothetical protein